MKRVTQKAVCKSVPKAELACGMFLWRDLLIYFIIPLRKADDSQYYIARMACSHTRPTKEEKLQSLVLY